MAPDEAFILRMQTAEALDDQAAARLLAESRARTIALASVVRLAAGVAFLVVGIAWTTNKQLSMGIVGLPLFVYVALASTFLACGQSALARRFFWAMSFVDVGLSFVVLRRVVSSGLPLMGAWTVVSLAANTIIVALAGLSLPPRLLALVTAADIAVEAVFLRQAGLDVWPILTSGLALAFVAAATGTVQRKATQALRQSYETQAARAALAKLREQNEALDQAQRERDSLLELIVHDMRGPVGAALLSLEYLAIELKKRPSQAALLEAADDGLSTLNSLSAMISQILDTSKLETGRLTLRTDVVPLRPLVEASTRNAAQRARGRSITLDFEARENIRAAVDLRLFPRALDALLTYGLRNTPEGGRALLAVTTTTTTTTTAETCISLHTTAPPVAAEDRLHAFDKLPQSHPDVRRIPAWGPGLYFCKLVAVSHQGTIALEDVDGWPTSFVIRLPSVPGSP